MQNMNIVVDVDKKIFKSCLDEKHINLRSDLKLTLTLSLTLGLGLGLTTGKTISVETLNEMENMNIVVDVQEKMFKSCVDKNFFVFEGTPS